MEGINHGNQSDPGRPEQPPDHPGTDLTDIELLDPGHKPVLAWRMPGLPA